MSKEILHQVADTVLEKPFYQFSTTPRPRTWFDKLLFKWGILKPKVKTYSLYPVTFSQAYRISKKIISINEGTIKQGTDSTLRDMFKLLINNEDALCYIVAVCLTESRQEPPESLIEELKHVKSAQLQEAGIALVNNLNITGFTHTIVSIVGTDIITPRETSPQVPGKPSAAS